MPTTLNLICPRCSQPVAATAECVTCPSCGAVYPVSRGVPILIDPNRSVFDPAAIASATTSWEQRRGLRRYVPRLTRNTAAPKNYARLRDLLLEENPTATVLVVGSGEGGQGFAELADPRLTLVASDVAIGTATSVGADAHHLPFADGSFDAVVVQAVLEHVADPWRCAEEIHRVLTADGLVYAETPFMQQVHMGAYDFTRFTPLGHRRLFRRFQEIESGMSAGPGSALAWSLCYFTASFARSRAARKVLMNLARVAFFWLRYLDRFQVTASGMDAAAGCYFLGRKSASVLSDQDLVASYRGAVG